MARPLPKYISNLSFWMEAEADVSSLAAMADFAYAQDDWYETWPKNLAERAMVVDSVKMWQRC